MSAMSMRSCSIFSLIGISPWIEYLGFAEPRMLIRNGPITETKLSWKIVANDFTQARISGRTAEKDFERGMQNSHLKKRLMGNGKDNEDGKSHRPNMGSSIAQMVYLGSKPRLLRFHGTI